MKKFGWLMALAIFGGALYGWRKSYVVQRERSRRIDSILQESRSYQAADAGIKSALQEAVALRPSTFAEFQRQCAVLQSALDKNDIMEQRKLKELADLREEFAEDSKMQPIFEDLARLERISDKVVLNWRDMIACSDNLASENREQQAAFESLCVVPAQDQMNRIEPEISTAISRLKSEVQSAGGSISPEVIQAIDQ